MESTTSDPKSPLLVLIADRHSAKLLSREEAGGLKEVWQRYGAEARSRGLGVAADHVAAPNEPAYDERAFVAELGDKLRTATEQDLGASVMLIVPPRFGDELKGAFGAALWKRVTHYVPRDETRLSESHLLRVVEQAMGTAAA
jgi:hypothetical protein